MNELGAKIFNAKVDYPNINEASKSELKIIWGLCCENKKSIEIIHKDRFLLLKFPAVDKNNNTKKSLSLKIKFTSANTILIE